MLPRCIAFNSRAPRSKVVCPVLTVTPMPDASRDLVPHQPIRLADYRPPSFLINSVDLVFDLGEDKTSVKARLAMRRNPAARDEKAALKLDGRDLELVSLALNGEKLGANRYAQDAESLTIPAV